MLEKHVQTSNFYFISTLFFLLLHFTTLSRTATPFQNWGLTAINVTFYISFIIFLYLILRKKLEVTKESFFYSSIFIFAATTLFTHVMHLDTTSKPLAITLFFLFFIIILLQTTWDAKQMMIFAHISVLISLLYFINWVALGFPVDRFTSIFTNPNISGVYFACLLFFPFVAFKQGNIATKIYLSIGITFSTILVYASSSRAVFLLLAVAIFSKIILSFSKKTFSSLFFFIIGFNLFFVLGYGLLAKSSYAQKLNDWSLEHFGKSFFSGRQEIWSAALSHGREAPIFGHKIGIVPKDFMEGTHYVHLHNQYIQTFLESGLVGLLCLLLFLFSIWKIYLKRLDSNLSQWSACFFLGILLYQSFEISLFFNMRELGLQSIGFLHWFIIAIGAAKVEKQSHRSTR